MQDAPVLRHRSAGLDCLRAAFALYVIFSHVIPWAGFAQGAGAVPNWLVQLNGGLIRIFQSTGETNPGVLGFIVLSGYCIHRSGFRAGSADLRDYALRRFWRIMPIYIVASIVGALAATWVLTLSPRAAAITATTDINLGCLAGKLVGVPAVWPSSYRCSYAGNAPLATVTAEIALYAVYPFLFIGLARRYREWALWVVVLAIWLVGVAAIILAPEYRNWWNNGSVYGFLLYWWIGAKFLDPGFARKVDQFLPIICAAWLVLTAALIFNMSPNSVALAEVRKVVLSLLVGALIARLDRLVIAPGLFPRLGQAGYSLYAFHAPVIYISLFLGFHWTLAVFAAIITGFVGFFLVEKPLLYIGRRMLAPVRY
jgi:peptidoglycan/LPS O-acetylase OafA/YrhL